MDTPKKDIRWQQRFSNYQKALKKLKVAIQIMGTMNKEGEGIARKDADNLSAIEELQKEGLIQRFEYTHELAWNVMKEYAEYQGSTNIKGSRDATREAFEMGLISGAEGWMDMIKSRNDTSHTYNSGVAEEIVQKIVNTYYLLFLDFEDKMKPYLKSGKTGIFDKEL